MSDAPPGQAPATYFLTGYPGLVGRRLLEHLVRAAPASRTYVLVQPGRLAQARRAAAALGPHAPRLLTGDVVDMHLGLSGEEYQRLCAEVTDIFHLAALSGLDVPRESAWRVNVDGTRNALELARDCQRLRRFNHLSSTYVSGDRPGVIAEDELECGQAFRNAFEETKYQAERLVQRAAGQLPASIYRVPTVVGDSRTGEIDRFEGPYSLGILLVTSPLNVPLPLPGAGTAPLQVVPVDFVVEALWALSREPRAAGRTFHLVDPSPMSVRRVYERVSQLVNRRVPRFSLPVRATAALLRLPLLERLARPQRTALGYANHLAFYSGENTLALLEGTGVRCPPLSAYLERLVAYVREHYRQRRELAAAVDDPLDGQGPGAGGGATEA